MLWLELYWAGQLVGGLELAGEGSGNDTIHGDGAIFGARIASSTLSGEPDVLHGGAGDDVLTREGDVNTQRTGESNSTGRRTRSSAVAITMAR